MQKDEVVNEFWCNLFICAGLLLSVLIVVITCIKKDDYSSLIYGGVVYMIPCTVECIKFILYDNKKYPFSNVIQNYIRELLKICLVYIIANLTFILYNTSNQVAIHIFSIITVMCMLGYPIKAGMFARFYFKQIARNEGEEKK